MTPPPAASGTAAATTPEILLTGSRQRHRREGAIRGAFLAAASLSILVSVLIVVSLVGEATSFLRQVDLDALASIGWFPRRGVYDVGTLVVGSLITTAIAMAVATPLGLAAAVYLAEYATPGMRRVLKPILEILAGIPSVVLGFFALTWINPNLVQRFFEGAAGFNLAAAGIGVGILVVPLVASVAEDALRAVPRSLREASYGLGAGKVTTTVRVVFPAAVSGIVASLVLAGSRAIGETMVVAIAAGASGGALFGLDPTEPGQTMTAAIASLATGTDQVRGASFAFQSLFFVGLLLFIITFALNVFGERFVRRARRHG